MKSLIRLAMPLMLALVLVAGASAASITYFSYSPGPTPGDFQTLSFGGNFVLPQFDDNGGTLILTGVTIEYISAWEGVEARYQNNSPSAVTASIQGQFVSLVSAPTLMDDIFTTPVLYNTGLQFIAPGGIIQSGPGPLAGISSATTATGLAPFSAFIGGGSLNFAYTAIFQVTNSFGGTFGQDVETARGRGVLSITYDFEERDEEPEPDPIPEPTTILLVGGALLGLGLFRRR